MTLDFTNPPILAAFIAFFVVFLLIYGIFQNFFQRGRRKEIISKIKKSSDSGWMQDQPGIMTSGTSEPSKKRMSKFLNGLGRRAVPTEKTEYSKMRLRFLRAGIRAEGFAGIFWGIKILLAVFSPIVFLIFRFMFFTLMNVRLTLIFCVLTAVLGYYLSDIIMHIKTAGRKDRLHKALPDALDLMVVCVEAGMGLDAAINRVAKEIEMAWPDLSHELTLLNLELRAGKARDGALRNLALRTNVDAVNSLVILLLQTDKFGTSVSSALKVFADGFRQERFQRAEELAAKLPVKLIFPLIFFIFPALFVVIAAPAWLSIYKNFILK